MVPVMLLCLVLSSWILKDTKCCGHGPHSRAELSYWLHRSNLQDHSMEFKGYVFKIMSGCDKLGFPMKQEVLTSGPPSTSQGATVVARPCGSIYHVSSLSCLLHGQSKRRTRCGGARARPADRGSLERRLMEHHHDHGDAASV